MTYANIKLEQHEVGYSDGRVEHPEPWMHAFIQPLIEALALKYPNYEFVECDACTQWGADDDRYYVADGFKVMHKREELGKIRVDHWCRTGERFWIENFRINAQKERGRGFKTKHQDKAMKFVSKFFGTRNTEELMEEAEKTADHVRGNINSNLNMDVRRLWMTLDDYAGMYMVKNWDSFNEWLKGFADPSVMEVANKYPETQTRMEEAQKINDLINAGKVWLVSIRDSDYIVKVKGQVSIMASEELPAMVRRNLGMLKLVQDRELITNVGIRANETTYYVVGENNE
jgi:hypothetical protein